MVGGYGVYLGYIAMCFSDMNSCMHVRSIVWSLQSWVGAAHCSYMLQWMSAICCVNYHRCVVFRGGKMGVHSQEGGWMGGNCLNRWNSPF